jgi:hypothetical protein
MNPTIAQAVAEARIADLHREAAARRLSRRMAARPSAGITMRNQWSAVRRATATWIAAHKPTPAQTNAACCVA